jgi:mono/diheme cytochrome c family protein
VRLLAAALVVLAAARVSAQELTAVVGTYCATCHDGRLRSPGGLLLESFSGAVADRPELWAKAYRQLQAGAMPPMGSPRPATAVVDAALAAIETGLQPESTRHPAASSQVAATRLAAMLWNAAPDAELKREADRDRLRDAAAVERQVRRMLADDRAQAVVVRFFFPWLQLDTLAKADPDTRFFPDYDVALRDALGKETELFLLSQLRDDRDPIELWSAAYTFLNERLSAHYGVAGVSGPQFRRVELTAPERAGLLGHGSVAMITSRHQHGVDAAYTTPATRAKWVRLRYFGAPLPNGFPGAQPVTPELPIAPQTRTLANEPCVNCHRNFFPIGYALENFDPLGRWRTHDQAGPVDVSGEFVDGTPTNGVVELRAALLRRPDAFRTTVIEGLVAYASTGAVTGPPGTAGTLAEARRILQATPPRWSALIAAVARAR